ncbi:trypsin-3-like [Babylonia areolata]|uniref:trypsin-3-like n=1 Tax=Babylonia areolata TaxID=304850 RepID=UPI003FCFEC47
MTQQSAEQVLPNRTETSCNKGPLAQMWDRRICYDRKPSRVAQSSAVHKQQHKAKGKDEKRTAAKMKTLLVLVFLAALAQVTETLPSSRERRDADQTRFYAPSQLRCKWLVLERFRYLQEDVYNACLDLDEKFPDDRKDFSCGWLVYFLNNPQDAGDDYWIAAELLYPEKCLNDTATTSRPTITTTFPLENTCGVSYPLRQKTRGSQGSRIVGGEETSDCSVVPWQVRLDLGGSMCGGSIISDRHILTAAHCLDGIRSVEQIIVIVGDHEISVTEPTERSFGVQHFLMHQDYNSYTYEHDIALLTLNEPMEFNECVWPICLTPPHTPSGENCTVSGWGTTSSGGRVSDVLKMAEVITHMGPMCKTAFNIYDQNYLPNTDVQLCGGFPDGGHDSCQGDSGGPLVCWSDENRSFVQVGVVSYGKGCALASFPGIYTNVAHYHSWIYSYMMQN